MRKFLLPVLLVTLVLSLAFPLPTYAIADPDTPPQVNAIYVFEFEDGSVGVLIDYYLDYAALPTETVTEAYLVVFTDTDGTTQLKSVAPYTFVDSGYGRGLAWIMFSPSEALTYSLSSASQADYRIWLVGNPTLTWAGDPPKTIATIDQWNSTGDMPTLLALRVLYYADQLELIWSLDMVEATALGNKLTTTGQSYFDNVITNLRTLAPACYANSSISPELNDLIYSTEFGAVMTNLTGNVTGSPITLSEGINTVNVTVAGTFSIILSSGTSGNITSGSGTVTGSPADLVWGTNNVTITVGTANVTLELVDTQMGINDTVTGTGFDLTAIATVFGMSRIMFSGLLWIILTVIICAATYGWGRHGENISASGAGNATMLVFGLCLIGGALLGLLDLRVLAVIAIGYAGFIGYIIFFRNSGGDIGKVVMFMGWMWLVVCILGGVMVGANITSSTKLTADITDSDNTITVSRTVGFRDTGIIVIGDERIAYHKVTSTTFEGSFLRPLVRGANGTTATSHLTGATVRPVEGALINDSLSYNIALLSDSSGIMAFVSMPVVLWDVLTSFIFLPLDFLGTEMAFLTYIWGTIALGLLVSVFISMVGGRRV